MTIMKTWDKKRSQLHLHKTFLSSAIFEEILSQKTNRPKLLKTPKKNSIERHSMKLIIRAHYTTRRICKPGLLPRKTQ